MDNLLLNETIQLLHDSADIDVYYYFLKEGLLYNLVKTDVVKLECSFEDFLESFHPADRLLFRNCFDFVASGASHYSNKVYRRKQKITDEEYKLYNIHTISHECENHEIDYVMYSMKDITDIVQKQKKQTIMLGKYKTIFYNLPFATVCFDNEGRVIEANSNAISMNREWFKTDIYKVNFLYAPGIDESMRKCINANKPFSRNIRFDLSNNEYKEVRVNYVPISDDGHFLGNMMLYDDITQEKEIERSNEVFMQKMKMVTEHFGLIHLDCYPETRTFTLEGGHALTHMENVPIEVAYDMLHPDDRHLLQEVVEASCISKPKAYEVNFRMHLAHHKEYRYVNLSLIPGCDESGNLICYTGLMVDNTDRVRQLEEKENTLRELRMAMDKAEESDRLKSAFLANISHEIRTPLNAITGFSDLLISGKNLANREEFCNIIHSNTERLLQLLSGIMDLSKLESGSIRFVNKEFEVRSFIEDIYNSYKFHLIARHEIDFVLDLGDEKCIIVSDENRVKEVLINFLNNAINYTSKGKITLRYSFDGENARMEVSDTGIGIRPECVGKVFNRFEKLGSLVPGTGLGLTICKNIMNILKGDIGVISKYGEGSTFWITLPAKPVSRIIF